MKYKTKVTAIGAMVQELAEDGNLIILFNDDINVHFGDDLKEEVINNYLRTYGLTDIKSMLYYPGYIPNKDLPALYSGATAFIYTSLRESFGIPILEAMACGTPVITSQTSAMPEIAGKDAISVNPYNPEEIVQAMVRLEEDPEYHHSLSQYGLRRVQQFSWKKTALKTLELYNEIIQQ